MPDVRVLLGDDRTVHTIRINGNAPTFRLRTDRIAAAVLANPTDVELDLLDIAAGVFAADSSFRRGGETRSDMGAAWRRRMHFEIPVRRPDIWAQPMVQELLSETLDVLMEDTVSFVFTQQPADRVPQEWLDFDRNAAPFRADEVILFSGGLDSFAGALEALSTSDRRVVLLTHRSAHKTVPHQVDLGKWLTKQYPGRLQHIHIAAHRVGSEAREQTQRSRSFLFAALAQVTARLLGAPRISFYENGIVSHNLPISAQVFGTMATRTTHPLSLKLIDDLHRLALASSVPIRNPYAWLTKTEVLQRIAQYGGAVAIPSAVSCTHVRSQERERTHCAACSQCLDRRFAVLAAGLAASEPTTIYKTDVLSGPREEPGSQTLAVEWTRHARDLHELSLAAFTIRFSVELSRITRGYPDLPSGDVLRMAHELHLRHAGAVVAVLTDAYRSCASDLAMQRLPRTSILALHAGMVGPNLAVDVIQHVPQPVPAAEADEQDWVLDPLPLTVRFSMENSLPVLDIVGITTLRGPQAKIVHVLRPWFAEDRDNGLPLANHRLMPAGQVAKAMVCNKDVVRQTVLRCRRAVRMEFRHVHGKEPPNDALIQSRPSAGYRLSPDLIIQKKHE